MTYEVPPAPADPKPRYVEVTDPDEIAAIKRGGLRDPIGGYNGDERWWATADSLVQYRQSKQFDVRAKFQEPKK